MWLLSTDRAKREAFNGPEHVPGGYVIFSHVWSDKEDTFQDVLAFNEKCAGSKENPRDLVSSKVSKFLSFAEKHGYRWAWADTTCINKESSAELSEGINSMFRYYTCAQVCYVYLADVPSSDKVWEKDSAFRRSRWHTRGWTLQEMLAPEMVIFLSKDWQILGTKSQLAALISEVTSIPQPVLKLEKDLADICISQRMSWAASRFTTREEDEAYCLLGIFGITMPTLYGEGRNAFYRLQQELMKRSTDPSLFLWGYSAPAVRLLSATQSQGQGPSIPRHDELHASHSTYLFADSPQLYFGDEFSNSPRWLPRSHGFFRPESFLRVKSWKSKQNRGEVSFDTTAYGVRAHVPVVELPTCIIAIISPREHEAFGLILTPCPQGNTDSSHPLYHCGLPRAFRHVRIRFVEDEKSSSSTFSSEWRDVYLAAQPEFRSTIAIAALPRPLARTNVELQVPFRVSGPALLALRDSRHVSLYASTSVAPDWDGTLPAVLIFRARFPMYFFSVHLGKCHANPKRTSHWACVRFHDFHKPPAHMSEEGGPLIPRPSLNAEQHACPEDHIWRWTQGTKEFSGSATSGIDWSTHSVSVGLTFSNFFLDDTRKTQELQYINYRSYLAPSNP